MQKKSSFGVTLLTLTKGKVSNIKLGEIMNIQELPQEILLHIFSYCDVYTISVIAKLNKRFRDLTLTPTLWEEIVRTRFSTTRHPKEKGNWLDLCKQIVSTMRTAKTLEELKNVAEKENLEWIHLHVSHFEILCKEAKKKNFDPKIAQLYNTEKMALWENAAKDHPLFISIGATNIKMVEILLNATRNDFRIFKKLSGFGNGVMSGVTPLHCASFSVGEQYSAIFTMILNKINANPKLLFEIISTNSIFNTLLSYGRGKDALLVLEIMKSNIDFVFSETQKINGKENVFHNLVLCGEQGESICTILFQQLNSNLGLLTTLMQERTREGGFELTPLGRARKAKNALVEKLYMSKLKELDLEVK